MPGHSVSVSLELSQSNPLHAFISDSRHFLDLHMFLAPLLLLSSGQNPSKDIGETAVDFTYYTICKKTLASSWKRIFRIELAAVYPLLMIIFIHIYEWKENGCWWWCYMTDSLHKTLWKCCLHSAIVSKFYLSFSWFHFCAGHKTVSDAFHTFSCCVYFAKPVG